MSKSYFYLILICLGLQAVSPATAEVVSDETATNEEIGLSPIALDAQGIKSDGLALNADPSTSIAVLAQNPASLVTSTANPMAETDLLSADLSTDLLIPPSPLLSQANPEISAPTLQTAIDALAQSTPVSQLQDIDARHWAAQALRQLSQRYNCLPNYFTEEAVLTRYEFADVLYTCMEVINRAILDSTAENASQEDLAVVQRLQEEFQGELAELGQRVDSLEEQIDTLEDQQFVKRTTLFGIAEFVALDTFGDSLPDQPGRARRNPPNANTTFTVGNLFLDIDAKVRGKDFIRTELFVTNTPSNNRNDTGTDMTRFDVLPEQSDFNLNYLFYQMKFAKRGVLRVGPIGLIANHIIPDLSPTQAPSRFGRRNPIYRPAAGGGFLANYQVNDWLGIGAGYTVGGSDAFTPEKGFFNGQNRFIAQATFTPTPKLGLGLTYSHLYQHAQVPITGRTGSRNAQAPFGDSTATTAHLLSFSGNYRINKRLGIGGWIGYNQATAADDARICQNGQENPVISCNNSSGNGLLGTVAKGDKADIWNWAIGMTVADVGRKGNELGFVFGMPPKTVSNDFQAFEDSKGTSYHAEMYYIYRINPRLSLIPGVYAVFNPEHNPDNNTLVVALLRTSMRF